MITEIAKEAATRLWGFRPGRDIKIVHLTNGMLRTMCGGEPKISKLLGELVATHAGREKLAAKNKRTAAQLLDEEKFDQILLGERAPVLLDDLRVALDAVLNQDAGHEVRSAIRVLKARADGLAVIEAQERIRIDIFLRDNLP